MTTATESATFEHTYTPRGACLQLFKTKAPEVLISGPAGTGKSRACLEKLHGVMLANPGAKGLIVRKTARSLSSSALDTFRKYVAKEGIAAGMLRWYGGSTEKPPGYIYENRSEVSVGGMDRETKVLSTEYDMIYVQEATELTTTDWEVLSTRCRNGVVSFQQMTADCNPDVPTHWLRQRSLGEAMVNLSSLHTDNPRLYDEVQRRDGRGDWRPKGDRPFDVERDGVRFRLTPYGRDYMGRLLNLTGVRLQRLAHGLWVAAEGVIYDGWDSSVHLVDRFPIPDGWERYWSIDWGFTNPMVIQCWAEDGDGRAFLYRELYHTRKLVSDHAGELMAIVKPGGKMVDGQYVGGEWREPRPRKVWADHDPEAQEQFRRVTGLKVENANKAVGAGIQEVQARLKLADDGRPRLFVLRDSVVVRDESLERDHKPACTVEEIPGYVWDDRKAEVPVKEDDHGCDAGRYFVMGRAVPSGGTRFRTL